MTVVHKQRCKLMLGLALSSFYLIVVSLLLPFRLAAQEAEQITLAYGLESYDFQHLLDTFTLQTGIIVNVKSFKNNELKSELIQRSTIKQLPDAIIVPSDFLGIDELRPSVIPNSLINKNVSKVALNTAKVKGELKGIPIVFGNHLVLYYNKSLVTTAPSTWQQLIKEQSNFSKPSNYIAWSYMEMYWFIPFLGVYDSVPYENGQIKLNTNEMISAFKWYKSLRDNKVVDTNCDYECANNRFKAGELAMTINGVWEYQANRTALGDKLGVASLPLKDNKHMRPYFSSHVIAFPDESLAGPKGKALRRLAAFFQTENTQETIGLDLNTVPTNEVSLNFVKQQSPADFDVMYKQIQNANPMPNEREMAIVWEALLKGLNRYLAGVFDAKTAVEYMQHVAEKSVNKESNDE
ncbi:extracellular solute-binding protein [Psychrosphaera ytuae]|uniref:Extracellular solute-binding protein n=1 Tax=Psychrosphaera ytuae TaxID=2820710 RepID=A0A975DCL5_9GAMM|nr:extracellular solute-binding protein [Psychrosphaera ytuae]QTH64489.1 extracellular solute-binding protein [Psychrosphaera ytuae]